jgi:pyridoxamine 5'-phosphate oxidase
LPKVLARTLVEATFYNDLDASLRHAWEELSLAGRDRRHGFRNLQLASVAADGTPRIRTLVLRGVEPDTATLRVHTDRRSDKLDELRLQPRVAVHAYDPVGKLQLRMLGRAELHLDDAIADAAWAATQDMGRVCYRVLPAPGTPLSAPGEAVFATAADADPGRAHFAAVRIQLDMMEWLYLAQTGHRRARWTAADNAWHGTWLAP